MNDRARVLRLLAVLLVAGGLAFSAGRTPVAAAAEKLTGEQVAGLMPQFFQLHLSQHDLSPEFMKRVLKEYVTQLDPFNRFYLKAESDAIVNLSDDELRALANECRNADFSHFKKIMKDYIDTQIARDNTLYDGLDGRAAEIKAQLADKVAKATEPNTSTPESAAKGESVAKSDNPIVVPDENGPGGDMEDEIDRIKWTERPATQAERESRLLKSTAVFYKNFRSYLSENESFKLALQNVSQERGKWAKITLDEEVPKTFLKAFMAAMDPHTNYFDAEEDDFAERLERSFAGIGVQIRPCPMGALIEDIIKGGPSDKSGKFARGDQIVKVDDFVLAGLPINKIVKRIKGEKGTIVNLTIRKRGSTDTEVVPIKRDTIELADMRVKGKKFDSPSGPIGLISVQNFYRGVHNDVRDRINELSAQKPLAGLILDLRFNQGGYLEEAVSMAGLFVGRRYIVGERDGRGVIDWKKDTESDSNVITVPLVVLTSQFSASASEIVAGSLKDYGRAVIVGPTQTYGKGTVQRVIPLNSLNLPGEVKITTHQYFVASGASTQLKGVEPDVTIPGFKMMEDMLEKASENPVPWNKIAGKIDAKDPQVKNWQTWKEEHVAKLQEDSKTRVAANVDYKDFYDPKKVKARNAAKATALPTNPDEAPSLDETKDEKDPQAEEAVAIVKDMVSSWPVTAK